MRKTVEELHSLNTKRLLQYYKAERDRYNVAISEYKQSDDSVDYYWDHSDKYEQEKAEFKEWDNYLKLIKKELNSREHIS